MPSEWQRAPCGLINSIPRTPFCSKMFTVLLLVYQEWNSAFSEVLSLEGRLLLTAYCGQQPFHLSNAVEGQWPTHPLRSSLEDRHEGACRSRSRADGFLCEVILRHTYILNLLRGLLEVQSLVKHSFYLTSSGEVKHSHLLRTECEAILIVSICPHLRLGEFKLWGGNIFKQMHNILQHTKSSLL